MSDERGPIETISAVTLAVTDMARSFAFYESLGFRLRYGGPDAAFTSFDPGTVVFEEGVITAVDVDQSALVLD